MRIALATVQVPFIRGGAELLASGLSAALVENGHHVDTVTMPFRFFPALRSPVAVLFAGMGGQYGALRDVVAQRRLTDRVRLLGEITREELASFYAHALAVFFGPRDEDYGYVTLEAMLAGRAVITCSDSGGPLEFVDEGVTGRVVAPEPKAIAEAIDQLYYDRRRAVAFGRAGYDKYQTLGMTRKHVVEKLLAA